jgi:hypothetical protein
MRVEPSPDTAAKARPHWPKSGGKRARRGSNPLWTPHRDPAVAISWGPIYGLPSALDRGVIAGAGCEQVSATAYRIEGLGNLGVEPSAALPASVGSVRSGPSRIEVEAKVSTQAFARDVPRGAVLVI